jgi:hypothetical protein
VACQRAFFKALHALVHLLTGHRQKRLLQSQLHVRIGQGLLGPAQLRPESGGLVNFIRGFHAYYLSMLATAKLPDPPHHGAVSQDAVLALHGPGTIPASFDFPDGLHFEGLTIANYFHDTQNFSFQSTNLFQDGISSMITYPFSRTPQS